MKTSTSCCPKRFESEGLTRSVTVARWAQMQHRVASHAVGIPHDVPTCSLMQQLLLAVAAQQTQARHALPRQRPLHRSQPGFALSMAGGLR